MRAYVYNVLRSFEKADALEDPTEDRGVIRKLDDGDSLRCEIKPGVILEVKLHREGISITEIGMSGSQQLTLMPTSTNQIYVTATRI